MKKFKLLPIVLVLLLSLSLLPVPALALTQPSIGAQAAILLNADTGDIYYEKSADRSVHPASTTKMVTALVVLEAAEQGEISLSDSVTATENCLYNLEEDSTDAEPRLEPGEVMSVEDLLYCAMLVSANEACNLLAEYVSGSVSDFVSRMNDRVAELGCENTHFANANGLEDPDHYSTARDLSIIAREALKNPTFREICGTLKHTVPSTNVAEARSLVNTNNLIDRDSDYYYEGAYGIKTGFFENAGYCLVSAVDKNNINAICVVLGGQDLGDQFGDSLTLYDWLYDNYEYRQILSSTETIITVPVEMGTSDSTGVRAENAVSVILPSDYDVSRIGYNYVLYHEADGRKLEAPVNAGEVLGELTVVELDENDNTVQTFGTSLLVAASTVEMSRGDFIRAEIRDLFQTPVVRRIVTILIIVLAIYLLLVAFYYTQRVRHLQSLRQAKKERAARQTEEEAQWLRIPDDADSDPEPGYLSGDDELQALGNSGKKRRAQDEDDFFDSFFKS